MRREIGKRDTATDSGKKIPARREQTRPEANHSGKRIKLLIPPGSARRRIVTRTHQEKN